MERNVSMNKRIYSIILIVLMLVNCCSGCAGKGPLAYEHPYHEYYKERSRGMYSQLEGMASNLAVISKKDQTDKDYESDDYADLLINDSKNEVVLSSNCFKKAYPASTTKIMTALLTLEHGDFDDKITLDHDIVMTEEGAVISTLSKGDTVSVDDVFHTMLIKSANDCAVILAEYIAGSTEKFADMMNKRARQLGATHTHFVNPNGLHDDDHYTTAYDMYLIFKEAVKYDKFVNTISMKSYQMTYENSLGQTVGEYVQTTNHYLLNEYPLPEGVVMYGGKTGTTSVARSCLVLMTENESGDRFFSIVFGAKTREDLYASMTKLLEKTLN